MTATDTKGYSFDLAEEMVQRLEQDFGPEVLRGELQKVAGDSPGGVPDDAQAGAFFTDFGRRWMARALELGEQYPDRTYEVLKQAAKKIEELRFPFLSQRFIEIAYLSTQPIYTLPIAENGAQGLVFKMPFCGYFKAIQESIGEEFASQLHCKSACVAACEVAFKHFGFDVDVTMGATMPADEYCQFRVVRA
jgi:hypothetical protein